MPGTRRPTVEGGRRGQEAGKLVRRTLKITHFCLSTARPLSPSPARAEHPQCPGHGMNTVLCPRGGTAPRDDKPGQNIGSPLRGPQQGRSSGGKVGGETDHPPEAGEGDVGRAGGGAGLDPEQWPEASGGSQREGRAEAPGSRVHVGSADTQAQESGGEEPWSTISALWLCGWRVVAG